MSLWAVALSSPRTFSMTTSGGRSWSMAYAMCVHSPLRVSGRSPARLPAWDRS